MYKTTPMRDMYNTFNILYKMKTLVKIAAVALVALMATSCCNCCCKDKEGKCCDKEKRECFDKGPRFGHHKPNPMFEEMKALDAQWAAFDSLSTDEQQAVIAKQKEMSKKRIEFAEKCMKDGKCPKDSMKCHRGHKRHCNKGQRPDGSRPDGEVPAPSPEQ